MIAVARSIERSEHRGSTGNCKTGGRLATGKAVSKGSQHEQTLADSTRAAQRIAWVHSAHAFPTPARQERTR
eukprot:7607843-Alexandrium_andersonii.AAC.1